MLVDIWIGSQKVGLGRHGGIQTAYAFMTVKLREHVERPAAVGDSSTLSTAGGGGSTDVTVLGLLLPNDCR